MIELRVSHTGEPCAYIGLIKRGTTVVWRCPHRHPNRDFDTTFTAARRCASLVLDALLDPAKTNAAIDSMRRHPPHFQYAWQGEEWQKTIERYEWALAQAECLRGQLPSPNVSDGGAP